MLQRFDRWSVKGRAGQVANVADSFRTFRRGVVAAGSEIAEAFEKVRDLLQRGFWLQARNGIAERGLLIEGKVGEGLLKAVLRFPIDPFQTVEDGIAVSGLCGIGRTDPFVDEVGHADGGGAG